MLSVLLILLALTSISFADQPVPAVPESQGLVTSTGADVVGMATETDAGAWTLTNGNEMYAIDFGNSNIVQLLPPAAIAQLLAAGGYASQTFTSGVPIPNGYSYVIVPQSLWNVPMGPPFSPGTTWGSFVMAAMTAGVSVQAYPGGIHTGSIGPGQIQYTTAYDASILAQAGHTVLVKSMNINTGNKVAAIQSNLKAETGLTYIATGDGGNVIGSENLLLDGAGNSTSASDRMLCPFASQPVDLIPAYCNIVQTGNSYDLTVGSVTSSVRERFIGTDATIPVQLDQDFNLKPYGSTEGSIPAMGSTSVYIKAHIQEARALNTINKTLTSPTNTYLVPIAPLKAEDLLYSETTSTSGVIQQFSKVIHYQSGKSLMP